MPLASASPSFTSPAEAYETRLRQFGAVAAQEDARSRVYSRLRLLVAAIVVAAIVGMVRSGAPAWAALLTAGVVAFAWLVVRHDRVERRRDAAQAMAALNRDALARLARRWSDLPAAWTPTIPDEHPFAVDLDVFGHASVAQVLGPVRTPTGRQALAGWLLHGADDPVEVIAARQAAVQELAPLLDVRQHLTALARALPDVPGDDARSLPHAVRWAEQPDGVAGRAWVPLVAVVLTACTLAGAVGTLVGVVTGSWWLLTGLLGWVLRWWVHEPIEHAIGGAAGEHGLRPWATAIDHVQSRTFAAPLLQAAQRDLSSAPPALRALEQLVALSDVRHSAWLFAPLQTLTLWDLHVWWAIERWRRRHGGGVRKWLEAVGRVEALGGLASLAFDHASWTFPDLSAAHDRLSAEGLGHPLLADAVRVTNDVTVGPTGRFLLVTGSNMSGKSTLLRAIGVNVVLAHAGGPVCASRLSLPPLALHTSMRISDSLELGLSLFMASLVRLKGIVTAAREARASRRVCYLLDEVLQGTNSGERQVAVRTVVEHLLGCQAVGVVTTHDLELAADPAFTARAESVHLQETLHGEGDAVTMTFDYRLRPGPAHAGNALRLLRVLGFDEG
ncbi:hypothetical protein TBR22_A41360 [Luteitalea sp. TBR-22]|uniref:MutS-related protein n=1 Tax=Luteitalea sp. TBR-22 TaxID=2802971 RepID=UPI001AF10818|nr:hypothetical protein [Luteitalea sp. TBR-22]BCS34910.1 hypothetical protein TBR22_A41360 [Luteitalea sp. TBR-22]